VIVDAAFLKYEQRELFRRLAQQSQVPFAIVHCEANEEISRQRLLRRNRADNDASDADFTVLEQQMLKIEPLADSELEHYHRADLAELLRWMRSG
jgi:predicted kinase